MQLLIRTTHKLPIVDTLHVSASQQGDVLVIVADDHVFTEHERTNPDWLIVHADITPEDETALLEAGREGEPDWRRRLGINIDGLVPGGTVTRDDLMGRTF